MPEDLKTPLETSDDGAAATASATDAGSKSDAEPTGETAEARIARIEKERDDARALSLSYKEKVEEANRLREENRTLKSRQTAATTDAIPPSIADIVPEIRGLDEQITRYGGDPNYSDHVASLRATRKALSLQAETRMRQERNDQLWQATMDNVKDEREQRLVYALVSSGRAGSVEDAIDAIRGKRLPDVERENAELKKKLADAETAQKLRGVDLTTRGVPAEEHARRGMPLAEWTKEWDAAQKRGDRGRMDELRKVARK
jgi:hypothetical protein